VVIRNTCPGQFEYEIRGFPKEVPPAARGAAEAALSDEGEGA